MDFLVVEVNFMMLLECDALKTHHFISISKYLYVNYVNNSEIIDKCSTVIDGMLGILPGFAFLWHIKRC